MESTDTKEKEILEINYNKTMIKRVTPYLNDITYIVYKGTNTERERKLTKEQRAFAWYYVHNGGNKCDAYRRAYMYKYNANTRKLVQHKEINAATVGTGGNRVFKMEQIQRCIQLIRQEIESKIKLDVPQTMLQQLQIQATYDPSMFVNVDGTAAFTKWDDIPREYRCCIENIEPGKYGSKIKLVDREVARKKLLQLAPGLLSPEKIEVKHTTVDKDGTEVGINQIGLDITNMTDEALQRIIQGNKED